MTYYGYYEAKVRSILDTVIRSVSKGEKRRFIWEESSYLSLWWNDERTSDTQRETLKSHFEEGRMELVGGGWAMHDEANSDLGSLLDQMTMGRQWLNSTFGGEEWSRPRHGWHIDPFGASSLSPQLFGQLLGYEALVLNRIPDPVKDEMKESQALEFLWQSVSGDVNASLFTHVLDSHYSTPPFAFCC
jgi:hypothetical protein